MARDTHSVEERDEFGRLRKDHNHRHDDNKDHPSSQHRHNQPPDRRSRGGGGEEESYHHNRDRRHRDGDEDRHHRRSDDDSRHHHSMRKDSKPNTTGIRDHREDRGLPVDHPGERGGRQDDYSEREQQQQQQPQGRDEYYGPAHGVEDTLPPGTVVQGTISRLETYGAFLDFNDPKTGENLRGLMHISQLASQRVEQVSDVVKLSQKMHAVVLDVEQERGRQRRIRLSLKDVDQESGKYQGPTLGGSSRGAGGGGRPPPPRELERRARQRRDSYLGFEVDWQKGSEEWNQPGAPGYLRRIWSASPEPPAHAGAPVDKKKVASSSKKKAESSSSESESSSDSDSSSEDRRRSKNKKRSRSDRQDRRGRKKSSHRRRDVSSSSESSSSSSSSSSPSSSDSRSEKRAKRSSASPGDGQKIPEDAQPAAGLTDDAEWKEAQALKEAVQGRSKPDEDSGEEGPMPLPQSNAAGGNANTSGSAYGKALLPGEGQAIAQYVQQNLRIPRRGEIGYSGDDIEHYEHSGYVMSGSRHTRMNAVRIRKENQVYSAEEQRALALITMEENQQKEAQLMEDFRIMLKEKKELREKGKT
jgi:predicted RNA-binding protein with RPS1 domain